MKGADGWRVLGPSCTAKGSASAAARYVSESVGYGCSSANEPPLRATALHTDLKYARQRQQHPAGKVRHVPAAAAL